MYNEKFLNGKITTTNNEHLPIGCDNYFEGFCGDTSKYCDGCYENSMRNWREEKEDFETYLK